MDDLARLATSADSVHQPRPSRTDPCRTGARAPREALALSAEDLELGPTQQLPRWLLLGPELGGPVTMIEFGRCLGPRHRRRALAGVCAHQRGGPGAGNGTRHAPCARTGRSGCPSPPIERAPAVLVRLHRLLLGACRRRRARCDVTSDKFGCHDPPPSLIRCHSRSPGWSRRPSLVDLGHAGALGDVVEADPPRSRSRWRSSPGPAALMSVAETSRSTVHTSNPRCFLRLCMQKSRIHPPPCPLKSKDIGPWTYVRDGRTHM